MTTSARESQIYKVKYITSQGVSAIYVFNGGRGGEQDKKKKGSTTTAGFTAEELQEIKQQSVKIISCKSKLYSDDSLATIKIKILQELWRSGDGGSGNEKITFDELYIFGQQKVTINPSLVYQALTQYKKLPLTRERVQKFVANIAGNKLAAAAGPETYTYNDLYSLLQGTTDSAIIDKTLGYRQILVRGEYPFICNPFNVTVYDEILERFIQSKQPLGSIVWKDGGKLLQDTGPIENNTILLCKAEDVMGHMTDVFGGNDAAVAHNIKYYFPGLYSKNIHSFAELQAKRGELMKLHAKIMTPKLDTYYQNVDMFYGVFEERKSELKYVSRGIKFIKAVMSPGFALKIPLEVLFKVIRAGPQVPLIKYNPASRQENMYRLYTQSVATDGRKIPALKKSIIMRLSKHIGKTKSVAVYMEGRLSDADADDPSTDTPTTPLICEFDEAGYMTFTAEFDEVVADIAVIDALFRQNVNPVIEEIRKVLEQSGYNFPLFRSMSAVEVEIKQITYETKISITKSLDIAGLRGCVSSVFVNETNTAGRKAAMPGKDIKLRFKRVSNYSAFNSQEAFIIEKAGQGYRGSDIILALMENFTELSRDQAVEMVSKIAAELEVEKGERQAELKIKENPGFKTTISLDLQTAEITVVTENINSVAYLNTLPIYIDTMIRLTQDKKSTGYPVGKITELCSGAAAVAAAATQETQTEQNYANPQFHVAAPPKFNNANADADANAADNDEVVVEFGSDDDDLGEDSIGSLSSLEDDMPVKKPAGKGAMNLFFGNLSDSDMSDQSGGAASDSSVSSMSDHGANNRGDDDDEDDDSDAEDAGDIRNIDGLKLNKPYYFQQMIENKDPALIVKEDTKEFNSYSRTCSSDKRRQPVILTDAQLDTIHQEHPGFLREQDVIKYGSDRKHQYNYICPRYWCLKTNTVVNPADLKEVKGPDGKIELQHPTCGKVLPKKENRVKPGYYIYEFYDETEEEGYPGLIPGKHPKGHCLPCCFKKYNTLGRIQAKKTCTANMLGTANAGVDVAPGVGAKGKKTAAAEILAAKREGEYILNPDKFPLDHGRWGHIPVEIQVMFRDIGAAAAVDCGSTVTTATTERPCLLRHGVEINKRQSFVACISDLLHYGRDEILTISAMRQKILKAMTIDSFLKYQNGNLVEMFYSFSPDRGDQKQDRPANVHKYQHSRLYASVYGSGASTSARYTGEYFKKVVSAFENFSAYMSDDESFIDHTYLWDIVSAPNKQLFPYGLNLIIFKLPHDDITNNVQLLCPTNHYSTELFSVKKPSVFLILDDGYYEPLYSYDHKTTGELSIIKEFGKANTPESIETIFKRLVRPFYEQVCRPMDSMPGVYRAKRGLLVDELIRELEAIGGEVGKHVMNFNSKIIGVMASLPGMGARAQCFVPCYPSVSSSSPDREDYVFMTDENLWQTYENTVHFLQKLSKLSKQKIPCAPTHKIVEDELIVGILTETGQFVQISHPIPATAAEGSFAGQLREIRDTSYITHDSSAVSARGQSSSQRGPSVQADVIIATEQGIDDDRYEYIKKIKMETQFYNVFRNTVRILLNDYKNIKLREQLKNETGSAWALYSESLKRITGLLRELVSDTIQFTGDDNYYKLIDDISTCVSHNGSVAGADAGTKAGETNTVCTITSGGKQTLLLPRNNLITGKPNEVAYFGKMADELLRYTQIKQFMFQPQVFLSFGNIGYNLKNTEMMLPQSSLTQEFFETLVPAVVNKYSHFNAADSVVPILGQYYDNVVDIHGRGHSHDHGHGEHAGVAVPELECPVKTYTTIRGLPADWNKCFPAGFKEIEFGAPNELLTTGKTGFGAPNEFLPTGKPGFGTLPACTFDVMINLLDAYVRGKEKFTIGILKNVLYTEYTRLGGDSAADTSRRSTIYLMLEAEGKRELLSVAAGVGREPVSFEFVYGETYYLTLLDMVIIAAKYQVPVVFVCAGAGAGAGERIIKAGGAGAQGVQSAIVFVSSSVTGATKTVVTANGELFFSIYSSVSSECRDRITAGIEIVGVDHVLELLRPAASAVAAVAPTGVKKPRAKRVIKAAAPEENVLQDDEVMPALLTPPGAAAAAKKTVRRTKKAVVAVADIKDAAAAAVPLVAKTVRKRVAKAKVV